MADVDITGLMAKSQVGWEKIAEKMCKPENFSITITPISIDIAELSLRDRERLGRKLELVAEAAKYMAAGMLKGTIKYESDDYDLKQWMAHLIGEGADQMNYQILLFDAWRRLQALS